MKEYRKVSAREELRKLADQIKAEAWETGEPIVAILDIARELNNIANHLGNVFYYVDDETGDSTFPFVLRSID